MIAVIPARGGSKRFPNKNMLLVPRAVERAKNAGLAVTIFTDDETLSQMENSVVKRSASSDEQSMKDAMIEFCKKAELSDEEFVICLYPTFWLRTSDDLSKLVEFIGDIKEDWDSVLGLRDLSTCVHLIYCAPKTLKPRPAFVCEDMIYREQDAAWRYKELTHFFCAFKVGNLKRLNSQLRGPNTHYLTADNVRSMVDVDRKIDLKIGKALEKCGIICDNE